MSEAPMRLLIVGGAGFAGSHLTARARAGGHEVVTTSRRQGAADLTVDPLDGAAVRDALADVAPSHVIDLDGLSSVAACWADPALALRCNAEGPATLVEALSPQGTLLGAAITLVGWGVLPLAVVLYILGTPARRRALQARERDADPASAEPDRGGHAAGDPVAPEREEP